LTKLRRLARRLGPGIITAALVFVPGSLTIASKLGALFEFQLLWVIIVATVLMMAFTGMGARIGIASDVSLLQRFRIKWGKFAALFAGIGLFLVAISFEAGNAIGSGIAFADTLHTSAAPWIVFILLCGISLLFFKSFYKILEKLMMIMIGVMLVSFLLTLVVARPDVALVAKGVVPSIPAGSLLLIVGLVASTFSIGGAFYQAYLVQEKGALREDAGDVVTESFIGIFVLGLISATILISSGAILYPQGIAVKSASDMGLALKPLYGNAASLLFMVGLFGASFSSLVGNATIGGALLADALSLGRDLSSRPVRILISVVMVVGAAVAIAFGRLPLKLIVFAQGVTIFVVPLIGVGIFIVANDAKCMGTLVNKKIDNALGVIGLIVLFGLAAANFKELLL
jgi:Mn2+/Fe2+ NRAMP family transporter